MENFYPATVQLEGVKNVVFLGIEPRYHIYETLLNQEFYYELVALKNLAELREWLVYLPDQEATSAIIADATLLAQEDFLLTKFIRQNVYLKSVPILAINQQGKTINKQLALKAGITDCLKYPLDWQLIFEKIKLLNQINEIKHLPKHPDYIPYRYQIPLSKRIFDIVVSSLAIFMLFPVFLAIGIAIKLESKGPIIYRSKRAGRGYQIFDFLKFRSMYKDADQKVKELQHLNQYKEEGDNCFFKVKNDPRITRVGRIIRKTSLDELPQLFNILKGDMSIVGNRPLPLYEAQSLVREDWVGRFLAPAGLTGLWQVTKRGKDNMSAEERVALDLEYAKNYSFIYDLGIIMRTLPAMVQHENV